MAYPKPKKKSSAENIDALYLDLNHPAFKEIFDNANDAMLAIHNDSAVHCYVNRGACEMTGYNIVELMNLGFKDLVHPEEIAKIDDRLEKRRKGVALPGCYETRIVTKNGEVIKYRQQKSRAGRKGERHHYFKDYANHQRTSNREGDKKILAGNQFNG